MDTIPRVRNIDAANLRREASKRRRIAPDCAKRDLKLAIDLGCRVPGQAWLSVERTAREALSSDWPLPGERKEAIRTLRYLKRLRRAALLYIARRHRAVVAEGARMSTLTASPVREAQAQALLCLLRKDGALYLNGHGYGRAQDHAGLSRGEVQRAVDHLVRAGVAWLHTAGGLVSVELTDEGDPS